MEDADDDASRPARLGIDVNAATIAFVEQLDSLGDLAPLKTSTSSRTIEITRALAAALATAGPERSFAHLTQASADRCVATSLEAREAR